MSPRRWSVLLWRSWQHEGHATPAARLTNVVDQRRPGPAGGRRYCRGRGGKSNRRGHAAAEQGGGDEQDGHELHGVLLLIFYLTQSGFVSGGCQVGHGGGALVGGGRRSAGISCAGAAVGSGAAGGSQAGAAGVGGVKSVSG